jgi:hypothetical protein
MEFLEQLKEICDAYDYHNINTFDDYHACGENVYNFTVEQMVKKGLLPQPKPVADWRDSGIVKPMDEAVADVREFLAEDNK